MSHAAPTSHTLNGPALELVCRTARRNIADVMSATVFRGEERKQAHQTIKECDNPAKLHSYLRSVRLERTRREAHMQQACEDGTYATGLSHD